MGNAPKKTDAVAEALARMRDVVTQANAKGLFSADFIMCIERAIQTHNARASAVATRPDGGDSLRALQGWADKLEHAHMELRAQGYRDTGLSVEGVHIHAETEMSAAKRQHFSETELAAQDKPAKESLEPLNADRGPKEVLNALSGPASETKLKMAAAINQSYVDELAANEVLREALEWYGEQARLCRLIHSGGDAGRHALANDGGKRAQAALAAKDGEQTNGST